MQLLWGIDLGGTKLEGVVSRADALLEPICRLRIDTQAYLGLEHIISRIGELLNMLQYECGEKPQTVGFGTPGALDPHKQAMKNCNTTCLNGAPLKSLLEERLSVQAVLSNDANCFVLAETLYGAGQGAQSVFGVIMGTGVGGGITVNGSLLEGRQGIAGEWGHNVLDPNGQRCYCGKIGCVETVISGPALEAYYAALSGVKLGLREIALKEASDPLAEQTISRLCMYFGQALSVVINILDPEVVVLGGGLSNIEALYTRGTAYVAENVFNSELETRIKKNQLGDSAGVFGAALLSRQTSK